MVRAAFLDRDGVIVKNIERDGKPCAPRTMAEFEILPDAKEAVTLLANNGYVVFVVTNQPDIGNKLLKQSVLDKMHKQIKREMPVAAIYTCPHTPQECCNCRKPKPGLLFQARDDFGIHMKTSIMIGDRETDKEAGINAGCRQSIMFMPDKTNLMSVLRGVIK